MQLQTTLTPLDGAFALWALVDLISRQGRLSREVRREARDLGLAVTVVLRRPADAAEQQAMTETDVAALIGWLVTGLETAGVPRSEVGAAFNRHVLAHRAPPVEVPTGHILVRASVLATLAAGVPVAEAADA